MLASHQCFLVSWMHTCVTTSKIMFWENSFKDVFERGSLNLGLLLYTILYKQMLQFGYSLSSGRLGPQCAGV